ncbi:E3 ubiquitin-protein ligase RNF25 [Episyrphus balteatus]|uniref:E3 ubiquitin-protein ligase RNF25 n=1 Tax=Episyrphus balteatus TaxID=286459 RepID=UPI00248668D0|nr:E3 ubiquitin-protein ligase RNF25 [Episyrphus balteatus]
MDVLLDEIESLEAILMDDVRIHRNTETNHPQIIETTIFPAVEHDSEEQYICVDLQVLPCDGYPDTSPKFNLVKPRGLDDSRLESMRLACIEKLKETRGFPVVFDLIDVVREHLTGSNLPCGQCVVCLYGFRDGDEFTKTKCYHYLHSYCLARHLLAARKNHQEEQEKLPAWIRKASEPFQASCPVCREAIEDESESLRSCILPKEMINAPDFQLTDELVTLQQEMSKLFIQQKKKGGIIDVEAEVGFVISTEPANTTEEQGNKHLGIETINYIKEGRLPIDRNPGRKYKCSGETSVQNQKPAQSTQKPNYCNKVVDSAEGNTSTNFAPVVSPSQRFASDPKNNNYHHHSNRRNFRGRRNHNYHHQRSDNASQVRTVIPPPGQASNSNKQQKDLPNCSTNTR